MAGTEHSLAAYIGSNRIATLSLVEDKLQWNYLDSWQRKGFPLSPYLPLNKSIPSENVERFLRNLLPEGNGLDELLASFHLSRYNTFGLIRALGLDIPGAIMILAPNQSIPDEPRFRPVSDTELTDRLRRREESSLIIWDAKPRLSNAGVQDKINVLIDFKGQLGFGEGSLCSTHILKFEKKKLTHLVLNEYVTMHLAKWCGLTVADVQIKRYGGYPALLVDRFDRKYISETNILRHHIIDGCQALNLPPEYKYERIYGGCRDVPHIRDGASYAKLFSFANQCINPAVTKLQILDWALFNVLVFNCDAHGKNISFFVGSDGIRIAPFYDLVNIKMYPDFDQEMAMAFGDEFDSDGINAYQLADFAETCGIDKLLVQRRLQILATKLMSILNNDFDREIKAKDEIEYYQKYKVSVVSRCQHLLVQAKLITTIQL